jgi:hypothetical protein
VVALVCAAALATRVLALQRGERVQRDLQEQAERAVAQAEDQLKLHLRKLQTRADGASSLPELRAQIGAVDAMTLRDGFASEPWWLPVRREAPMTALAIVGETIDVSLGVAENDFDAASLIRQAREGRQASGAALAKGVPCLAAAALIEKPGRRLRPVLVLARPIDDELVGEVGRAAGTAIMMTDGRKPLATSGSEAQKAWLQPLAGSEESPPAPMPGFAARTVQLGPNLWVWAQAQGTIPTGLPPGAIPIWIGAGVGSFTALFLGFRRKSLQPGPLLRSPIPGTPTPEAPGEGYGQPAHTDEGKEMGGPSDAESQQPGEGSASVFGRYTLLDRIGEGAMAEVYTAVAHGAEGFKRMFVLKRLHAHLAGRQDLVNMFIDEARLGSSLVHSNIIPVFDFGRVGNEYFMATEYILGRDLTKITQKAVSENGKPVPMEIALYCARGVLEALDYAHTLHDENGQAVGLVHRDVSPNNILLSLRGEVKLFDFGIAKAEGRRTHTEVGSVKGNCGFMSSEQAQGKPVDARSDLCSLGLTLYFALAGESLYEGASVIQLLSKAGRGPTDNEWAKIARLPEGIRELIWLSIQADPDKRYISAADMLSATNALPSADASTVAKFMDRLFGVELKAERDRFQSVKTATTVLRSPQRPPAAGRR